MKLVKCGNGHFYDEERYQNCPHCTAPSVRDDNLTQPLMRGPVNDEVTVAMSSTMSESVAPAPVTPAPQVSKEGGSLQDAVNAASGGMTASLDGDKTVGFFSRKIGTEPVVGWLVCVAGEHFGEDFKLKSGRNFIGRSASMDVAITRDTTVSRERHAVVVYEPRGNKFIVQPGESKELCYLNDDVVLSPCEIKLHDHLVVGKTELMFVPCCTESFNWDMVQAPDTKE